MTREYIVPGNLLLAGEYAITAEGGLGIALAPARFLRLRAVPGSRFLLEGQAHGAALDGGGLAEAVLAAAAEILSVPVSDKRFAARVFADSTELFFAPGKKLGLGSSAALAVGLAAFFVDCIHPLGPEPSPEECEPVLRIALRGHRAFQSGGSGYDVHASFYGGTGLFRGGEKPLWNPIRIADGMELTLIPAEESVRSGPAVRSFKKLQAERGVDVARFLACSNRAVRHLEAALTAGAGQAGDGQIRGPSACALFRAITGVRRVGLWIGRNLGLDPEGGQLAGVLADLRTRGIPAKASGAGGELAIAFGFPPVYYSPEVEVFSVKLARDGVRWR